LSKKHSFSFISLGCAKNLVDSEEIIGSLISKGYKLESEVKESEIVIVNTCAFLHEARLEALDTIRELAAIKRSGKSKLRKIVVAGCLVQYLEWLKIKKTLPGVDLFVPLKEYQKIPSLLEILLERKAARNNVTAGGGSPGEFVIQTGRNRFLSGSTHSVYIKIAEGCNNRCSYCLIPFLRGELRSRKIEDILSEVKAVQKLGAVEINLIAQDTTAYGLDLYGKPMLGELLRDLCTLQSIKWIRILYTQPSHITDDLLKVIQSEPSICKYLDIPIQHINTKILRLMGRKTGPGEIVSLYNKIRRMIPEIALRTTVMVGFPGEEEAEFNELLTFLRQYPFEKVGAFIFSAERGSPAYNLPDRVKPEIAEKRLIQILNQQKEISRNFNRSLLGREVKVLIDNYEQHKNKAYGRMANQAPEVDGRVIITGTPGGAEVPRVSPGDLVNVKITGTGSYDLIGEFVAGKGKYKKPSYTLK
jgi:ribosomal protein S12 methylthiotransferase